ncbi:MAG TPA: hypothetical protein ENI23_01285 [bacterium]|nr:hypothetical protein [bacterium]
MEKNIVIFDKDGTIANVDHRKHFLEGPEVTDEDWEKFNFAAVDDIPNEDVLTILDQLYLADFKIFIWTGASYIAKDVVLKWLEENVMEYHELKMRPISDHSPDTELKEKWLMELGPENVFAVFEDRDDQVEMFRSHGVRVYQVDDNPSFAQ